MKRLILIAAFILTAGTLAAQNYIIVNSEKVFKSVAAYNKAISDLDELAKQYQEQVDAKFAEVEALYNAYMNQKASLSATTRQTRENAILNKEKEAQEAEAGADAPVKKEGKPRIKNAVKAAIDAEEAAVADVVAAVETPFEEPAEVAAEEAAVVAEEAAAVAAEEVAEAKAE